MREINFRAWDKLTKRIIDPFSITFYRQKGFGIEISIENDMYANDPNTILRALEDIVIMQFTGLKDKNCKEIYEGDIVKGSKPQFIGNCVGVVKYGGLAFHFSGTCDSKEEYSSPNWFYTVTNPTVKELDEIEIIGNIYENPGYLKQEKLI